MESKQCECPECSLEREQPGSMEKVREFSAMLIEKQTNKEQK